MRIRDWLFLPVRDGFKLAGLTPGGNSILTSRVVFVDTIYRQVHTESGSIYDLGNVDTEYRDMYESSGQGKYVPLWRAH